MKRKLMASFLILIMVAFSIFIFQTRYSKRAIRSRDNERNVELVKIGMEKFKMLEIMGTPDDISDHPINSKIRIYYYEPSFGASDGIYIYLQNDWRVTEIIKDN